MQKPENDLPDGKQLANDIAELFKSRAGMSLFDSPQANPLDFCENQELLKRRGMIDQYKEGFFSYIDPGSCRRVNGRDAAIQVREYFSNWHSDVLKKLRDAVTPESRILYPVLRALTLKDMAEFARTRFEESKKAVASKIPNTREYLQERAKSDYWSIMDQIIGPAADPD